MNMGKEYKSKVVRIMQKLTGQQQQTPAQPATGQPNIAPDEHVTPAYVPEPEVIKVVEKPKGFVPIIDNLFSHIPDDRRFFNWDRDVSKYKHVFLTDMCITSHHNFNDKVKYAWMVESPEITPEQYKWLSTNLDKFEQVFTFKRTLLDADPERCKFVPGGACWIKEEDWGVHPKTKLLSFVTSNKNYTSGHVLRQRIIQRLGQSFDVYGRGYNEIPDKITGLKDYMFSLAVENTKEDYYFTEKLLDCFMTGTVPIYYGCPSIGDFFNPEGIIQINSLQDAEQVIKQLHAGTYQRMLPAVIDNYNRCMNQFLSYEDYMYNNYKDSLFPVDYDNTKSPLNNVADEVYCINLERRLDRWKEVSQEFAKHNIEATRWLAVDGWQIKGQHHMKHSDMKGEAIKGAVGCLRSHRAALKDAIEKDHDVIAIFEDDVVLQPNFNERFKRLMKDTPNNWDMLYLGCHWHGLPHPTPIGNDIFKLRCFGVFGVLIKKHMIRQIYEITAPEDRPLDDYLCHYVHPRRNIYTTIPFLVKVKEDFSDIANQFADYKIVSKYFY